MTIPNVITCARIALVPVFGWLWSAGRHRDALVVYAVAGASDVVDGFLARVLHQPSRLGAILDPAADKLMLLVAFLVGASQHAVPWWLAGVVIGRDVLLSVGAGVVALAFRSRGFSLRIHPTRLGKYSTFFQITTILAALLQRAADLPAAGPWVGALVWICGLFTIGAGVQYAIGAALALAGEPTHAPPRPLGTRIAP